MYRITWFIEDAWDAIAFSVLSIIAWLDNPKLWDNVKLFGLAVVTLLCAWSTVLVYNAPGTWREPIAGVAGVALFVICTAQAFLMLIYYGCQQAKRDALKE